MLRLFLLSVVCCVAVSGHEYFPGQCPNFTPMSGFDWAQFSTGIWFVTQKFATKSTCLTYEFKTDDLGFKSIEQVRQLPYTDRLPLEHEYIYTGKLYAPQESSPAKMIVRFPLNVVGSSSFTVMDTDYDNHAMVCTCQDMDLFFTYAHRRSCSILQREQEEDPAITEKMRKLIDDQIEDASHDFDRIKQAGCDYNKEKVLNIDVDKILGLKGDSGLREAVESVASEFEFNKKTLKEIQEEARDILK
eukprot:GFUD01032786.1.p1 GENE.GFUD01032786.1~~GFUD01032786.1.p1  ORF type:complete len:246 (+),score=73.72 GFUD01032786.1:189-926(+)